MSADFPPQWRRRNRQRVLSPTCHPHPDEYLIHEAQLKKVARGKPLFCFRTLALRDTHTATEYCSNIPSHTSQNLPSPFFCVSTVWCTIIARIGYTRLTQLCHALCSFSSIPFHKPSHIDITLSTIARITETNTPVPWTVFFLDLCQTYLSDSYLTCSKAT